MEIREIDANTFNDYASKHILKNYFQTKQYGELMSHSDFKVMYIGAFIDNNIVAASIILNKTIGPSMKYGYAPRGFLINYYDEDLLSMFTKKIKDFFFKKGYAFIKINPEITYAKVNFDKQSKIINTKNKQLIDTLKELGYDKLKDNLYFESMLPKFTPVIYLPTYNLNDLNSEIIDNATEAQKCGISIKKGNIDDIDTFYNIIKKNDSKSISYYKLFYEIFSKDDMADLLFLELDYVTYIKYLQIRYSIENEKNEIINRKFNLNPQDNNLYIEKMESDKELNKIQAQIASYNFKVQDDKNKETLAACLVIKHEGRITMLISGTSSEFTLCDLKSFLYYKVIEEYKKSGFLFFDLNGITGDYSETNPYKELNKFKLQFNPNVFEYIGEFDLIVNKPFHQLLWSTNKIQKEFYKPAIKNKQN